MAGPELAVKLTIGLILLGVVFALGLFAIDAFLGDAVAQWSSIVFGLIIGLAATCATVVIARGRS